MLFFWFSNFLSAIYVEPFSDIGCYLFGKVIALVTKNMFGAYIRFSEEHMKLRFTEKHCSFLKENYNPSIKLTQIQLLGFPYIFSHGFNVVVECIRACARRRLIDFGYLLFFF